MNNKIEKLAQQIDIIKRPNTSGSGWDYTISEHQLEMFAELIINQCAELAEDYDGAHYIGTVIKEHFGVGDE